MADSGLSIGTAPGGDEYAVTLATCCREALLLAEFTADRAHTTLTEPTSATKTGR